jgi:hypothetical protein
MSEHQAVTAREGAPRDAARIDLRAPDAVGYWTRELGVSEEILREAVDHAGAEVEAVRHYLGSGS